MIALISLKLRLNIIPILSIATLNFVPLQVVVHHDVEVEVPSHAHPGDVGVQEVGRHWAGFLEEDDVQQDGHPHQSHIHHRRHHHFLPEEQWAPHQIKEPLHQVDAQARSPFHAGLAQVEVAGDEDADVEGAPDGSEGPLGRGDLGLVELGVPVVVGGQPGRVFLLCHGWIWVIILIYFLPVGQKFIPISSFLGDQENNRINTCL